MLPIKRKVNTLRAAHRQRHAALLVSPALGSAVASLEVIIEQTDVGFKGFSHQFDRFFGIVFPVWLRP